MTVLGGLANLASRLLTSTGAAGRGTGSAGPTGGQPSGPTPREEAALRRARTVADLLDEAFTVPGTNYRVGLDPILGILPGAGDTLAAIIALYPVYEAYRLGVPGATLAKMLLLVGVDLVVGSIPVLGPVFDAVWKANEWNVNTLEAHVRGPDHGGSQPV